MWIQPMKFIHTSSVSHAPICVCAYHLVWIPVTFTTVKIKKSLSQGLLCHSYGPQTPLSP